MRWWQWALGTFVIIAAGLAALVFALLPPDIAPPPRSDMVISGVTVVNPGAGRLANRTIIVHDGRIAAIRERRADDPAPLCPGCFALPGLIDAHVHTPPRIALGNQRLFALLYLEYGVTSVRDMGQSEPSVADLAADLNAGRIVGPHMYRCGPVLDGDPPGWPAARRVVTPAEGRAAVDDIAATGADCIKVYNEVNLPTYRAIAAEAAHFGLPVLGHVPHPVGLLNLSNFEAQHLTGFPYLTRPLPPPGDDLRAEDLLAMSNSEIAHVLDITAERNISLLPTLANSELRLIASDPRRFPPTPGARDLPAFWGPVWGALVDHPRTQQQITRQPLMLARIYAITGRARLRGIDVLAGTDTIMPWVVPGESLHIEIARLSQAFDSNEAALAAATAVNGRHIADGQIGILAPGARADILLLPSDPMRDLARLRDWKILIADGRRYDRATVDAWVAEYRAHFHGWLYSGVMNTIVGVVLRQFQSTAAAKQP
ncbi:MAG TPA: amidohydrolase family protein [Rhizomicrobium sp.]|jgi:hypothetical protein